jgi:hypothetical protein
VKVPGRPAAGPLSPALRPKRAPVRFSIEEIDDGIWIVSFLRYDLGFIDPEQEACPPVSS